TDGGLEPEERLNPARRGVLDKDRGLSVLRLEATWRHRCRRGAERGSDRTRPVKSAQIPRQREQIAPPTVRREECGRRRSVVAFKRGAKLPQPQASGGFGPIKCEASCHGGVHCMQVGAPKRPTSERPRYDRALVPLVRAGCAVVCVIVAIFVPSTAVAQSVLAGDTIHISRAAGRIVIDGDLSDEGWHQATRIDKWYETQPGDNVEPKVKNVGYLTFD